jgi:hypothetical protein
MINCWLNDKVAPSPLREKAGMRGIKLVDFNLLTPTLSSRRGGFNFLHY